MLSWAVQRNIFYQERDRIRAQFEANAVLTQPGQISSAIAAGEATLAEYSHPDPYTCLLYTSPSPRDGLLSRMPSSA